MQMSKLKSIKKIRKHILIVKIFVIIYSICFALIYLISQTEAQFTNASVQKQVIQAGEWWDGSNLTFSSSENQIIDSCGPVDLTVEIKNDSTNGMYGASEYEVYNASLKEGDSLEISDRVSDGVLEIGIIEAGETASLTYTVSTPGDYFFRAYQRPKYDNNEAERTSIMSEVLTVTCLEEGINNGVENNESVSPGEPEINKDEELEESDCTLEQNKDEGPEESDCVLEENKDEVLGESDSALEQNKQDATSSEELPQNSNGNHKGEQSTEGDETDE